MNWFCSNRSDSSVPVIVKIETTGTDYRVTDFNEKELWSGWYEMKTVTVTVMADMGEEHNTGPVLSRLHLSTAEEMGWDKKFSTAAASGLVITVWHERWTTQKIALGAGELLLLAVNSDGVRVSRHLIGWDDGEWDEDWDSNQHEEIYRHGKPVDGLGAMGIHKWRAALESLGDCIPAEVNFALYMAMSDLPEDRQALTLSLLHELDYLIHHGDLPSFAVSPEHFIVAMTSTPEMILDLALTLPWEHARQIMGPYELTRWLEENHPASRDKARKEMKAEGYPKQDFDPATGERFPVYPVDMFYDNEHPLYYSTPDSARPENWRELEHLVYNPAGPKAKRQPMTT